jgi:ribosome-interacting GTPase 1
MRIFYLFIACFILLEARENPFVPTDKTIKIGIATNKKSPIKQFESKNIDLPSTSRILKNITVTFQNLDGTTQSITSKIDKKVDWHKPLILTQKTNSHESLKSKPKTGAVKSYKMSDFFAFDISKNKITLHSKDNIIRDFMITNPYKIVIDFKSDLDFATKSKQLDYENFVKATLGNHEGYYRLVIELDGQYTYKLDENKIILY